MKKPELTYVAEVSPHSYSTRIIDDTTTVVRKDVHEYDDFMEDYRQKKREGAVGPSPEKMLQYTAQKTFSQELES